MADLGAAAVAMQGAAPKADSSRRCGLWHPEAAHLGFCSDDSALFTGSLQQNKSSPELRGGRGSFSQACLHMRHTLHPRARKNSCSFCDVINKNSSVRHLPSPACAADAAHHHAAAHLEIITDCWLRRGNLDAAVQRSHQWPWCMVAHT